MAYEEVGEYSNSTNLAEPRGSDPLDTTDGSPSFEDIAREAYAIYMANGAKEGRDVEDWLAAETRLRAVGLNTRHTLND